MDMTQVSRNWDQPEGTTPGNWQYINDRRIAAGYDESLANSPIVTLDEKILLENLPSKTEGATVVDFGCGTGRNLVPLIELGWRAVGVDLSVPMLMEFSKKLRKSVAPESTIDSQVALVQSNLIDLAGLSSASADLGLCLFSTFGMIPGRGNRARFLAEVSRILKPDAPFFVHVHNYWRHASSAAGIGWMIRNGLDAMRKRCDWGDRFANYRTVDRMMLHHFSLRKVLAELEASGFKANKTFGILDDETVTIRIRLGTHFRAIGWLIECRRATTATIDESS